MMPATDHQVSYAASLHMSNKYFTLSILQNEHSALPVPLFSCISNCLFGVGSTSILLNEIKIFLSVKVYILNILLQISINTQQATKDFSQHYTLCYYPNINVRIRCSCSAINTITSPFQEYFSTNLCAKMNMVVLCYLINIQAQRSPFAFLYFEKKQPFFLD